MDEAKKAQPVAAFEESIGLPEDVQAWRSQLIRGVLLALVVLGGLAVAGAMYDAYVGQVLWQIPIILGAYLLLLVVALWRRVLYGLQVGVLLFLTYAMGVFNLFIAGQLGDGFPFLLTLPILAALFLGRRMGIIALVVATATLTVFGWALVSGSYVIPPESLPTVTEFGSWLSRILVFVMLALLLLLPLNFLFQRLVAALTQSRDLARELEAQRAGLEEAVVERTADLARRSAQLETAARVARDAALIQDVPQLLDETVHLVSERFGFYHTGIFLLDERREYAVLRAASSEGGRRMLARGHRLKVGEVGIVGYVTGRAEARVALNVGRDAVYFDNPDLPDTRSEMALPLRIRGEVIGALDVQSVEAEAFSDEDVTVLQTLADQLAAAISNARLFEQVQASLEAERRAYGEMSAKAWQELSRARPDLVYRYDPHDVLTGEGRWREEMEQAVRERRPIVASDGSGAVLALPLKVREQVVGVLDARKPEGSGEWTAEDLAVMETLAEQLGVALESARLYQETQQRAARDRLVSQVTNRMRESLDVRRVLETAADEIYQTLGLEKVVIRLAAGDEEILT